MVLTQCISSSLCGLLQAHQPTDNDVGAGAPTDHLQPRAPEQALNPSPHTWPQPALLLHSHQLQVQPSQSDLLGMISILHVS